MDSESLVTDSNNCLHGPQLIDNEIVAHVLDSDRTNLIATKETLSQNATNGARCLGADERLYTSDVSDHDLTTTAATNTYSLRNRTIQHSKKPITSEFSELVSSAQRILNHPPTLDTFTLHDQLPPLQDLETLAANNQRKLKQLISEQEQRLRDVTPTSLNSQLNRQPTTKRTLHPAWRTNYLADKYGSNQLSSAITNNDNTIVQHHANDVDPTTLPSATNTTNAIHYINELDKLKRQISDLTLQLTAKQHQSTNKHSPVMSSDEYDSDVRVSCSKNVKNVYKNKSHKSAPQRRIRKDFIKLDRYDGKTPLEAFLVHFNTCSDYNEWN